MTDRATPVLSQLIVDWMSAMTIPEQVARLKMIGIPHDRREEYVSAIASQPAVLAIEPGPTTLEITPEMALEGGPLVKDRPQPGVGNRNPKSVPSTKKS
jgi:hypothetical protein